MATIEIKTPADRYKAIADAIRKKNGSTELMQPADMPSVILSLSGGTTLNIAYGETPPEDTSKLWIKANEPNNVSVGSDIDGVGSVANVGSLLNPCDGIGCARVGNIIYLLGGFEGGYSNKIYTFDLETETLTALSTTLPTVCYNVDCATVGKKIYLFGGSCGGSDTYLNTINVFDTETETITTLSAKLPKRTIDMGCASVGTKIYLFGGMYYNSGYYDLTTINVFDTETETLTTLGVTLPKRNYGMACASVGTKIYLLGGHSRNNGAWTTIDVFDTETQTITTLNTTLPTNWYDMGCSAIGTKIYLFGGYDNRNYLNTIGVFDTETETIEILENTLPIGCQNIGCSAYGNKVYLFGGYDAGIRLNPINCFTLTHELAKGDIEVQSGLLNNKFNLINTESAKVQIGVENVYVGNENNEAERVDAYLHNGTEWVQV